MRVFATDLAAYNHSYLVGRWIELGIEKEELHKTISEILKEGEEACADGSIHEEYFLTDWENNEFNLEVGEYSEEYSREKKIKKLAIGKKLIEELAKNSKVTILNLTTKGEHLSNVPKISIENLKILLESE